jgi:cysteinyl-tRNA synthetase
MSMKYLGETLDIHSGGLDHIPVHHENEIAQSESATGQPFVRYFVHNAFLTGMAGAKISKSEGKFPVVDDLIAAEINPLAFRLLCFGAKYRSELAFSLEAVRAAEKNLYYFYGFTALAQYDAADSSWTNQFRDRFQAALNDDLNTPQALAVALELVKTAHRTSDFRIWQTLKTFDSVMGLDLEQQLGMVRSLQFPGNVERLHQSRQEARRNKDFRRADDIRRELSALGYVVRDEPGGSSSLAPKWS